MAEILNFMAAKLKRDPSLYRIVAIDDEDNLKVKNCLGQDWDIDCMEWADISVWRNKAGENPFWPKCEKEDFSDDFDNMTEEQDANYKAWDMERILKYSPIEEGKYIFTMSSTDWEIVA